MKFGLDKPALEATFTLGPDKARKTLQVGLVGEGKEAKAYAHLVEGGPIAEVDVNLIKDQSWKPVSRSPRSLRRAV